MILDQFIVKLAHEIIYLFHTRKAYESIHSLPADCNAREFGEASLYIIEQPVACVKALRYTALICDDFGYIRKHRQRWSSVLDSSVLSLFVGERWRSNCQVGGFE